MATVYTHQYTLKLIEIRSIVELKRRHPPFEVPLVFHIKILILLYQIILNDILDLLTEMMQLIPAAKENNTTGIIVTQPWFNTCCVSQIACTVIFFFYKSNNLAPSNSVLACKHYLHTASISVFLG